MTHPELKRVSSPASHRIPVACPVLNGNEAKYVQECLETSWVSSIGRFIPAFESSFAEFVGVPHAVSANNGTAALHLALLAHGLSPGDEVIVPTLTFIATANAVTYCGAKPVFVDSEPLTMNLDPARIEEKITPRTKGIIAVHLYGHPADMDPILEIARRHNLFVIEDAAEAHGALYRGRMAGSIAPLAAFSFFGNKILSTGEGGMITTSSQELASSIRLLRGQGMDPGRRYWFPIVGYNYRMTNIEAALGLAQLEKVHWHLERRREVAAWYFEELQSLSEFLTLPTQQPWASHSYWLFTIILKPSVPCSRDEFMARLDALGIETRPVFYPMHVLPPYREATPDYPVAEALSASGLSLPTHAALSREDVHAICTAVRSLCVPA